MLDCYLTTSKATVVLFIINHTELTWCHPMNGRISMNQVFPLSYLFNRRSQVFRCMTNLESDVHELSGVIVLILMKRLREEMEIMNTEVLFIGCLRIVTVTDKKNILLNIFLDHKPMTTAEAQTLALSDGMEPQAFVLTNSHACFQFNHIAWLFA